MRDVVRLIGIDPGLRFTGWGVLEATGNRLIHIADGVLRIIELLDAAAPDAPILLYPIFPRGHRRSSEMRRITSKANDSLLSRLPRRRRLIVRDLRNAFLDDEGNVQRRLMPDYLHLSRAGYEIWAADIKAALAR